jgi:predicted flavoprotein YhiN
MDALYIVYLRPSTTRDIIRFFEELGIALKEEDNGRMFPVSNSAKDVVDALLQKVRSVNVQINPIRQ